MEKTSTVQKIALKYCEFEPQRRENPPRVSMSVLLLTSGECSVTPHSSVAGCQLERRETAEAA
jgi:hypothetical protein